MSSFTKNLKTTALAGALAALACACSRPPEVKYFQQGEDLYLKGEYDAAIVQFKQQLIKKPDDAGAHFYLGTCYLYAANKNLGAKQNAWLGIAQGELETALGLFLRGGKVNPVPRFNAEYFEMMCHINQAKIYLMLTDAVAQNPRMFGGVNPGVVIPEFISKCAEQAKQAELVAPGNPDVEQLKRILAQIGAPIASTTPVPKENPNQTPQRDPAKPHRESAAPLSV